MRYLRTAPVFMLMAFCLGSLFLLAPTYHMNVQYDRLAFQIIILYLVWIHFSGIPYCNLYSKLRWVFILIWAASCIVFNLALNFPPEHDIIDLATKWGAPDGIPKSSAFQHGAATGLAWLLFKPAILGAIFWKTYVLQCRYDSPSDPVSTGNVHICLWRPHNARSLIQSLCGIAVGSVSLYLDGSLYGFRWGRPGYTHRRVDPRVLPRKFIVIDTGVPATDQIRRELGKLIGSPAGAFRCRCVWVIRYILKIIHPDLAPRWHHMVPARYGIRVLKWRRSHG